VTAFFKHVLTFIDQLFAIWFKHVGRMITTEILFTPVFIFARRQPCPDEALIILYVILGAVFGGTTFMRGWKDVVVAKTGGARPPAPPETPSPA
jgi:hypothetical protein